ncbi:hypothetical protein PMAYCL1PPCAC_15759 [Pristionchus mayeri]|uniref:Elongation of very long chain fatty acids protein n=1 Tax=Pristionchus mayeri TaxID=1317129 RepID=A0AAN5CJI5_9BILA|nr:hypothetical protein PMAYCL1PPCAC_15759 [Pristionchus mayeri]
MARFDYWPRYGYDNYSVILPFEDSYDGKKFTSWMQANWAHSLSVSAAYVIVIFAGRKLMESRKPFSLDTPLFVWNAGLAIFSILGFLRVTPEWFWSWRGENDLTYSICVASYTHAVSGFWTQQFVLSKIVELLDTVFIVARKRPLLFLHWYHHISVLVYTWHAYKDHTASGRWFVWMNYGVHAVMYSYYAIRSLKWRAPKWIAMFITVLQISQMIAGITIGISVYRIKASGGECHQTWGNLFLNLAMYFSYFILFCNFFYHAYIKKNNRYAVLDTKKETSSGETKERQEEKKESNGVTTRRRAHKVD